jgi:N-acyl-D-amino-acid deacylase
MEIGGMKTGGMKMGGRLRTAGAIFIVAMAMARLVATIGAQASEQHTGPAASGRSFDVIIEKGRIIDGTGNPWYRADVGITDRRIAAIGDLSRASATRRIDAAGKVVCPGFIDMHSHASWGLLVDGRAASKITQGVTLEVEGEGSSVAPLTDAMVKVRRARFDRLKMNPDWRSLADFFRRFERTPPTINFATYLGTQNVREMVIGFDDRPATPQELERMRQITRQAMDDGALGIYSALMYSPDRFNRTEELIAMAKVAAEYGGVYQSHIRSESNAVDAALDEVFRISREARIPAHITHFKVTYKQNWGRMPAILEKIENARRSGLDITADLYPYVRAGGGFTPLLPPWAQDGGREKIVQRLKDPAIRERIKKELAEPTDAWENEYYGAGGGPAGFSITDGGGNPTLKKYEGKTLAEVAAIERKDPRDVVMDIVLAGDAGMTVLITDENDLRLAIQRPWVAFGSDGETVAPDGPLSEGLVHPRGYGTYPKILGEYVRQHGLITLEDAIRKASSLPAQRLGIRDRGLLRTGFYADLVVFDPDTIIDKATYEKPHQFAEGISHVLVNGQLVVDSGKITDARPGMIVRGPGHKRSAGGPSL